MPQVVVAALTIFGNAVVAVGAIGTAMGFGIGVGALAAGAAVVIGGVMVAKRVMSLFEIEIPTVDTDASRQRTVKSTTEPQKIIYGEALVSGPISFIGLSGTDNSDLYQTIVLAGHEVTEITDIHMDDIVISNADINGGSAAGGAVGSGSVEFGPKNGTICVIKKHLGEASQTADVLLTGPFTNYTSAHRGDGIAYLAMKWVLNKDSAETWEKFSPSNVKALVKGKPVYDPRLDTGAPNYNPLNQLFITYNATAGSYVGQGQNPALVLADYLISDLGMGISPSKIDWSSFITAANGCDVSVSVPGGTEKRFTCNGVLFATDSHQKNINKILSSMNGNLVYSNGKYIVHAGIYEAHSESLNEDDLIGAISIKTSLERSDRFNTIKGLFVDPAQNHKSSEFPKVQLTDAVIRDNNEVLEKEVQYPMTNSSYMAQRLSHKLIQLSDQQKVITFPANLSALRITAGDRVQVTVEELNWTDKIFQCAGWTFSEEGGVNLTLREDSESSYEDPAVNEYSTVTATGDITDAFRGVPSPSGLRAASGEKKVFLNWVNPGKPSDFGTIEIYASASNNIANAVKIGETDGTQFVHDGNNAADQIAVDDTRYYWIRSKKNVGTVAENAVSVYQPNSTTGVGPVTVLATLVDWDNVADPTIGIDINNDTISINTGVANTTTGQDVATSGIEAGTTVTQGGITMNQGGSIKGGQGAYNSGTGFFLGYDTNAYKFSIGNSSTEALTFDGTNLAVTGAITATSGSIANSVTVGGTAASTVSSGAAAGATASQVNKGLALLLNQTANGSSNVGEGGLVGVDKDGDPETGTDGFIIYNGDKITVERAQYSTDITILTNVANKRGFICFDANKTDVFTTTSYGNLNVAFVWKEGTQWYYDDNASGVSFIPSSIPGQVNGTDGTDIPILLAIGFLETSTSDLILTGGLFEPIALETAPFAGDTYNSGTIGGININTSAIYSGSKSSFADTDQGFWIGSNGTMSFANGTANTLEFDTNGDLSVTGDITATSGTFNGTVNASAGAFTGDVSTDSKFIAGSGATSATMDGGDQNYRIYAGGATPDLSSFKVDSDGVVTATRLVVTRPDDLSAVIFDSARDGLVGIGLASISQDTGIVVQAPSVELTSQTDTVSVVLTASQTLTLETILALPTAKKYAGNYSTAQYPASMTATMQYSTNSGSSWSTFGAAVVLTRTAASSPSDISKFKVLTAAIDGLGNTGYRRDVHAIDAINNIHFIKSVAGFAAGSYLFRVQLSFVAGSSPDTDYEPNITGNRTLQFGTDGAGFTVDEYGVITDSPSGTATIGYVQANYAALNNGNTITVGSGETNTFEDESSNEILVVSDTEVVARNLFRATWNGAQPTGTKIIRVTNPTGTAERFSVTEAGNLTTTTLGVTGDATITGDLTVNGTTTTVNTDNLTVKDNNITLNYSTGDSSSTANDAGITIQDAVDASTDASLLWKTASDTFEFSHGVTVKPSTVTGAVVGSNVTLEVQATEGQIQVIATDTGDWASNIVLSNYTASTRRHYWIHNAPSTASVNAGKFELRTSATTTGSQIGGQGSGSTALLVVDSSGNVDSAGKVSAATNYVYGSTNYHFVMNENDGASYIGNINGSAIISSGGYYYGGNLRQLNSGVQNYSALNLMPTGEIIFEQIVGATAGSAVNRTVPFQINTSGNLSVSGTISSGAINSSGNITLAEYLYHSGNTGTNLRFLTNRAILTSGGGASVDAHSNSNLYLTGTNIVGYGNYTSTGTISSGAITSSGEIDVNLSAEGKYFEGGSGNIRRLSITSGTNVSAHAKHTFDIASSNGKYVFQTNAADRLTLDSSGATFAGTISSGAITSTGNSTHGGYSSWTGGGGVAGIFMHYNATNSYRSYFDWRTLQLGNNGGNNILAGSTSAGGYFRFYTNATEISQSGGTSGNLALTLEADADAVFGGNLYIPEYLYHTGNTGTNLRFTTDKAVITAAHTAVTAGAANNQKFEIGASSSTTPVGFLFETVNKDGTAASDKSLRMFMSETGYNSGNTNYPYSYGFSLVYEGSGAAPLDFDSGFTSTLGNGEWGIYGHQNSVDGVLIVHSDRAGNFYNILISGTNALAINSSRNATFAGTVSWSGGGSANANTAYTYSQVGHLPLAGGTLSGTLTASGGLALNNANITGVNALSFNDPGPNEGISWTSGNTAIFESPDDLTTNTAGNLQFVYGTTRRLTVNNTGIDVNGTISSGAITAKSLTLTDDQSASPLLKISADDSGPWAIQLYREDLSGGPQVFASYADTFSFQGNIDIRSGFNLQSAGATVIDSDRNITAANGMLATGIWINNDQPSANNAVFSGYGVIGNRSTLYITNGGGVIQIGNGNTHNSNPSATFSTTSLSLGANRAFKMNGIEIISAARNLNNLGNIRTTADNSYSIYGCSWSGNFGWRQISIY